MSILNLGACSCECFICITRLDAVIICCVLAVYLLLMETIKEEEPPAARVAAPHPADSQLLNELQDSNEPVIEDASHDGSTTINSRAPVDGEKRAGPGPCSSQSQSTSSMTPRRGVPPKRSHSIRKLIKADLDLRWSDSESDDEQSRSYSPSPPPNLITASRNSLASVDGLADYKEQDINKLLAAREYFTEKNLTFDETHDSFKLRNDQPNNGFAERGDKAPHCAPDFNGNPLNGSEKGDRYQSVPAPRRACEREEDDALISSWSSTSEENNNSEGLALTFQELRHIRTAITKAELDCIGVTRALKNDLEKGRICFTCMKQKFSFFGPWSVRCKLCQRDVCERCSTKMHVRQDAFSSRIPAQLLAPGCAHTFSRRQRGNSVTSDGCDIGTDKCEPAREVRVRSASSDDCRLSRPRTPAVLEPIERQKSQEEGAPRKVGRSLSFGWFDRLKSGSHCGEMLDDIRLCTDCQYFVIRSVLEKTDKQIKTS